MPIYAPIEGYGSIIAQSAQEIVESNLPFSLPIFPHTITDKSAIDIYTVFNIQTGDITLKLNDTVIRNASFNNDGYYQGRVVLAARKNKFLILSGYGLFNDTIYEEGCPYEIPVNLNETNFITIEGNSASISCYRFKVIGDPAPLYPASLLGIPKIDPTLELEIDIPNSNFQAGNNDLEPEWISQDDARRTNDDPPGELDNLAYGSAFSLAPIASKRWGANFNQIIDLPVNANSLIDSGKSELKLEYFQASRINNGYNTARVDITFLDTDDNVLWIYEGIGTDLSTWQETENIVTIPINSRKICLTPQAKGNDNDNAASAFAKFKGFIQENENINQNGIHYLDIINGAKVNGTTGWNVTNGFNADSTTLERSPFCGELYWYAGIDSANDIGEQIINVPNDSITDIDNGNATIKCRWAQSDSIENGKDEGRVNLYFLDSTDNEIGNSLVPLIEGISGWDVRENSSTLPIGTRKIRCEMEGVRTSNSNNNVYIDAICGRIET